MVKSPVGCGVCVVVAAVVVGVCVVVGDVGVTVMVPLVWWVTPCADPITVMG